MSVRWLGLFLACMILPAAAISCTDDDLGEANAIVTDIPWSAPESYAYDIVNDDQEKQGEGTLSIVERDGRAYIVQQFEDDEGNSDMSVIAVDPATLEPFAGERTIIDTEDDRRVILDSEYGTLDDGSYGVRIRERNFDPADDDEPSSERCNPLKLAENTYDNDSSLFLWRTIEFRERNDVAYTASLPNRRLRRDVTLEVMEQTQVETPAGQFDAWRVRIRTSDQTQNAWFATTDDHKLLVYDNGEQIFLYTGEAGPPDFDVPEGVPEECE